MVLHLDGTPLLRDWLLLWTPSRWLWEVVLCHWLRKGHLIRVKVYFLQGVTEGVAEVVVHLLYGASEVATCAFGHVPCRSSATLPAWPWWASSLDSVGDIMKSSIKTSPPLPLTWLSTTENLSLFNFAPRVIITVNMVWSVWVGLPFDVLFMAGHFTRCCSDFLFVETTATFQHSRHCSVTPSLAPPPFDQKPLPAILVLHYSLYLLCFAFLVSPDTRPSVYGGPSIVQYLPPMCSTARTEM